MNQVGRATLNVVVGLAVFITSPVWLPVIVFWFIFHDIGAAVLASRTDGTRATTATKQAVKKEVTQ